jgi:N-acetylneuraminate synthase
MVKIISEIGINHNGSIELCKELIMLAKVSGSDYAKLQKRDPDICVPDHQKNKPKSTPWGDMTYLEYKKKIEFNEEQIIELIKFGKEIGIEVFASVWDVESAKLMSRHTNIAKIGSACITDIELCKVTRELFKTVIISTGMSTEGEIEECVKVCNPDVIMHTNSTYPSDVEELNLRYIEWLKNKWTGKEIGYSGHEYGLVPTFASVALGATWVERHITLDRNMWGSDQKSSVEPEGLIKLVRGIRNLEKSIQYEPQERIQFESEVAKKNTLRKV